MSVGSVVRRCRQSAAGLSLALGAIVLLAACGGGGDGSNGEKTQPAATKVAATQAATTGASQPTTAASSAIDACALVTKAEVEAAAGVTVGEPKAGTLANLRTCSFEDPAPPNFSVVDVSVLTGIRDGDAREIFDMAKKNGNDPQTVAGLGEDASWDDVLHTLNVVKDNYMVGVDVSADSADRLSVAKEIAGKVLSRLP